MNEELQRKILELLGNAEDFAVATAPQVVQNVLLWAQIAWIPGFVALCLCLAVTAASGYGFHRARRAHSEEVEAACFISAFVFAVLGIITAAWTLDTLGTAFHAYFAPYSYLLSRFVG